MPNRLIHQKSPYLLAHAENPVDWYPWGNEAFNEARRRDIPIFLSIGYSSCHWCHVMEQENFIDNEVASILNDNFISIKVDREERPDIDHIYMEACTMLNGSGGWPLTIFLLEDKIPFFAGTYFPREDGRQMGFKSLLKRIINMWKGRRETLLNAGEEIIKELRSKKSNVTNETVNIEELYMKIVQDYDPVYGGFGNAPKFPTPEIILFMLRYYNINPTSNAKSIIEKTLLGMANGGIFDHIGGGFFRYSTDRKWLVPHFEKMLYDNAMLIMAFAEAGKAIDSKYNSVVERIINFLLRDMKGKCGGFYTAIDADSEGEEGKYYLFTPDEINEVLGKPEGTKFNDQYDITNYGNFEGKNIPNCIQKGFTLSDERNDKILLYRNKRVFPFVDDKITTSSNGLIIAALAIAGRLNNREEWLSLAENTAEFIGKHLFLGGRLMARWRQGEAAHPSTLDDYAYLLWGYMELYYGTKNNKWLLRAIDLTNKIIHLFSDVRGGLFLTGRDVTDLPIRAKSYYDGALPSGNAVCAYNFIRIAELTNDDKLTSIANEILSDVKADMIKYPYGFSGHIIAFMQKENGSNLTVTAGKGLNKILELASLYKPFLNISLVNQSDEDVADMILNFKNKVSIEGNATAYFCDRNGCRPPITDYSKLLELI